MPNSLLADLVLGVAQRLVDALRQDITEKKLVATKNLRSSVNIGDFQENANGVTVPIEMANYYFWADQGRRKGKRPPIASIEEWISAKGIPVRKSKEQSTQSVLEARKSMALAIAKKIASKGTIKRFGYKGGNFIGDVLTPANIDAIAQHLGDALGCQPGLFGYQLCGHFDQLRTGKFQVYCGNQKRIRHYDCQTESPDISRHYR